MYWEGLKQEWVDCLSDPTCAATIALSSVHGALSRFETPIVKTGQQLYGSGPSSGIIEVSDRVQSVSAFKNYSPSANPVTGTRAVEFIYDVERKTFIVGRANNNSAFLSPHQKLAYELRGEILSHNNNSSVIGGIFMRRADGTIILDEMSGHFYRNYAKHPNIQNEITVIRLKFKIT